jgi:hypothetical protein
MKLSPGEHLRLLQHPTYACVFLLNFIFVNNPWMLPR